MFFLIFLVAVKLPSSLTVSLRVIFWLLLPVAWSSPAIVTVMRSGGVSPSVSSWPAIRMKYFLSVTSNRIEGFVDFLRRARRDLVVDDEVEQKSLKRPQCAVAGENEDPRRENGEIDAASNSGSSRVHRTTFRA